MIASRSSLRYDRSADGVRMIAPQQEIICENFVFDHLIIPEDDRIAPHDLCSTKRPASMINHTAESRVSQCRCGHFLVHWVRNSA